MIALQRLLPALLVTAAGCAGGGRASPVARGAEEALAPACLRGRTVVLVRHAEKAVDGGKDPSLSERGKARARVLAGMLSDAGVTRLVATPWRRTQETLAPLAERISRRVEVASPNEAKELLRTAPDGAVTVVASHANVIPSLVRELANGAKLRGVEGEHLAEDDYGRVVVITQPCGAKASVVELSSSVE